MTFVVDFFGCSLHRSTTSSIVRTVFFLVLVFSSCLSYMSFLNIILGGFHNFYQIASRDGQEIGVKTCSKGATGQTRTQAFAF